MGLVVNAQVDHLVRFIDAWHTTRLDSHMMPMCSYQLSTIKNLSCGCDGIFYMLIPDVHQLMSS